MLRPNWKYIDSMNREFHLVVCDIRLLHGKPRAFVVLSEWNTHSLGQTDKMLMVIVRHNCKLFWERHTKASHTSWQAVRSPEIRPLWPCQYLFRCCDCSPVSLGVCLGFTLPVWELEEMGERPRSVRGIHLRSTPLLTLLNLVIKSDAELMMFYENWQGMLTVSSVVSNISLKLWRGKPHREREERGHLMKVWKSRVRSLKDLQLDDGNMVNIMALLSLMD